VDVCQWYRRTKDDILTKDAIDADNNIPPATKNQHGCDNQHTDGHQGRSR